MHSITLVKLALYKDAGIGSQFLRKFIPAMNPNWKTLPGGKLYHPGFDTTSASPFINQLFAGTEVRPNIRAVLRNARYAASASGDQFTRFKTLLNQRIKADFEAKKGLMFNYGPGKGTSILKARTPTQLEMPAVNQYSTEWKGNAQKALNDYLDNYDPFKNMLENLPFATGTTSVVRAA